jgi:flavin-dependent thymidylate synthase
VVTKLEKRKILHIEILKSDTPTDVAVSSARSCYSGKGIVKPEDSSNWSRKETLLVDLFRSGHHTTLQHTNLTLLISGVSRHLIWRLLHSHTFYSSEQVSQRYAKMRVENMFYPKNGDRSEWESFYRERFADYEKLSEILEEPIREVLPKFQKKSASKKAMEIARYVLPQGTTAHLYHTVNLLTALRYISISKNFPEATTEIRIFGKMLEKRLLELDSNLQPILELVKKEGVQFPDIDVSKYKNRGDIFDIVGDLSFEVESNYAGVLRNSQILHDEGIIGGFTSYSKLSLSADAQNQRHRRSLGIRPLLEKDFSEEFYTPKILQRVPEAVDIFNNSISKSYKFFREQRERIGFGEAIYSLPNSHIVGVVERIDWSSFHHKAQMRLCWNAQEEIYDITYNQVKKFREMGLAGSEKLLPPCGVRAKEKIYPLCPEGDRYCGTKVWKLEFEEYRRDI